MERTLNKTVDKPWKVLGHETIDDLNSNGTVVDKATMLLFQELPMSIWSIIGVSINAAAGIDLKRPVDIAEYFMKVLSEQEYLEWAYNMLRNTEEAKNGK